MNERLRDDSRRPREIDALIRRELKRPVGAPDLTRAIMGRLGYMRAAPAVARRRRIRRWTNRAVFFMGMLLTALIGFHAHNASSDARRPLDVTIPAAVGGDLRHHQDRFQNVLRLFRDLPARLEVPAAETDPDSAPEGMELDDEVIRSAVAPVRWV